MFNLFKEDNYLAIDIHRILVPANESKKKIDEVIDDVVEYIKICTILEGKKRRKILGILRDYMEKKGHVLYITGYVETERENGTKGIIRVDVSKVGS